MKKSTRVSFLCIIYILCVCAALMGGAYGCSTYTEFYSEKELEQELAAVPNTLTHTDVEDRTLTVTLSYPNGYDGAAYGGYWDLPTYDSRAIDGRASMHVEPSIPVQFAMYASDLLVPDVYAAIEPNSGNSMNLTVSLDIQVVDKDGVTILSRSLERVDLYYGKGKSRDSKNTDYEFLFLTTPQGSATEIMFLFDRRNFSADFDLVRMRPSQAMVREGGEVLYVSVDPDLEPMDFGQDMGVAEDMSGVDMFSPDM